MTDVTLVIAVGETRGKLSQVAFADWLAAQCAERLRTGSPAIHQTEFHMRPPLGSLLPTIFAFEAQIMVLYIARSDIAAIMHRYELLERRLEETTRSGSNQ